MADGMLDSVVDVRLLRRGSFDTNCTESRELGFMLPAPRASFLVDVRCLQLSRFLARRTPGFVGLESHKTSWKFIECVILGVPPSAGVIE